MLCVRVNEFTELNENQIFIILNYKVEEVLKPQGIRRHKTHTNNKTF